MMHDRLSHFEDRVQRLIEGGLSRLLAGYLHPREVAVQLARAMEDHVITRKDLRVAPDVYVVWMNPQDHAAILGEHHDVAARMAAELVEVARMAGLALARLPEVRLLADQQIAPHQVTISAQHSSPQSDSTQAMPRTDIQDQPIPKAELIVDGGQRITLSKPVINLGRGRHNEITIDDPRVSRRHAQIRLRSGYHLIFDLGSMAGTTVNNRPIQEMVLQSGDIIGLAGHSLIYIVGEESADPAQAAGLPDDGRAD